MKLLIRCSLIILITIASQFSFAQDYSEQAKSFFADYLDSKSFKELCSKSFPTLEDCKLVFRGQDAYTYFGFIEENVKIKMEDEQEKQTEKFVDLRVESFTTEDIQIDRGNYAGGMKQVLDKLQTRATFYEISLLREKGAKYGVAYKYFVNIRGRWIFFPKPWNAFKGNAVDNNR